VLCARSLAFPTPSLPVVRWIVGKGEMAVELAERVRKMLRGEVVTTDVEDDVDELTDAAAVLFASDEQGGDGSVPLVVADRLMVEERCGEVADGVAEFVEGEWSVHQKLHPVVGRAVGSMPAPWS